LSSSPTFDWDPAGPDRVLAVARGDVAALRIGGAREALADTRARGDFDTRAFRSLVLAAAAVSSDVVETWAKEEPENPDALLLYARVAAHRALTAQRERDRGMLEAIAAKACAAAHRAWPVDPTPFVVELTLLRLRRSAPGGAPARPPGTAADPAWALWREAEARHAGNREAGQRLLALCYPRHGGSGELASDTAAYLASVGPPYGINQLLPLLADLEQDRRSGPAEPDPQRVAKIHQLLGHLTAQGPMEPQAEQRRRTLLEMLDLELRGEQAIDPVAEELTRVWFGVNSHDGPPRSATVSDFSVLAEALHRGGRFGPAWLVLRHIHPYASPFPWSRHGPPDKVLARVYRDCRRG
jgi:hypothetical protein